MFKPPHFFEKKRTIYKNDNGAAAVGVLLGLTFYIFMISFILSFLIINIYGVDVVSGIKLPNIGNSYSSEQNYQNGSYDIDVNKQMLWSKWNYIKDVGLVLQELNFLEPNGYVAFKYVQPDSEGKYTNTYYINNSVHADYCVAMKLSGNEHDKNEVCVNSEGIYIPEWIHELGIIWGNKVFYSYPNANLLDDVVIKTVYNEKLLTDDVYFNNILVISTNNIENIVTPLLNPTEYYGGVGSHNAGFTLKTFHTENSVVITNDTNILSSLSNLLATMFAISIWSIPSWILPIEFVVIFITLPEAGIVLTALIVLIRGVD